MKKFLASTILGLLLFTGISAISTEVASAQRIKRFRFHFRCVGGRRIIITVRTRRTRYTAESYAYGRARARGCVAPRLIRTVRL